MTEPGYRATPPRFDYGPSDSPMRGIVYVLALVAVIVSLSFLVAVL